MSGLRVAVCDYLALRRALGYALKDAEPLLTDFVDYLENSGAAHVSAELALAWATRPVGASPVWRRQRLGAVRGFAQYLQSIDPLTEVPSPDLLPTTYNRVTPYLYSDADVAALMSGAQALSPALRAATYSTLIGLLVVAGLRIGEAIALDRADVKQDTSTLEVRAAKSGSSREIPLHDTTIEALRSYQQLQDRHFPQPKSPSLFVSIRGTRMCYSAVNPTFCQLVRQAGLVPRGGRCRPRIHDTRHSFAVHTLIRWYQQGVDVDARLPLLSAFLGHANPASTYWYLQAAPELLSIVGQRLEHLLVGAS
ncbi:MAG: tyrosine-type recombinase/integrase [Dermatophilaceae bacterium]